MPPRPSRPRMRYRLSRTIPGLKRPWSIEPDELGQPLCDVGAEDGVREAAPEPGSCRGVDAGRVASLVSSTVRSDTATDRPQPGQKRLPAGSGAWQCGQV